MSSRSTGRIVFIDVDGTIIDHDEYVAPSAAAAIRGARERGHLVYLCTGRARGDLHPAVRAIGFDGAITNGGATAHVGEEQILSQLMPAASVSRLVRSFDAHGMHYFLQTDDEVFASSGMLALVRERVRAARAARADGPEDSLAGVGNRTYRDVADAPADTIAKAVFVSGDADAVRLLDAELGDEFHVVNGSMPFTGGTSGEIALLGTNKGSAIETVLQHLELDAADAVGVGDSWNDVEMFEVCGTAVAMGNAEPTLKGLADHITTTVRADGVWNAFRTLGLVD